MMAPEAAWRLTIHEFFMALEGYRKANSSGTEPMTRAELEALLDGNETRPSIKKKGAPPAKAAAVSRKAKRRKRKDKRKWQTPPNA